jgi:hypothetical protein
MSIDEIFARLEAQLLEPTKRVLTAVRPIYQSEGRRYPRLVGTGVLLRIAERVVLVTAAHVVDLAADEPLFFAPGQKLRSVPRDLYATIPPHGKRSADKFDLAVIGLGPELESELNIAHPLGETEIRIFERPDLAIGRKTRYLVMGFSRSAQPRVPAGRVINAVPLHPIVIAREESAYPALGTAPDSHLLLGYDLADFALERKGDLLSNPHGMSGGGVWRIDNTQGEDDARLSLVGIIIEHHAEPYHTMIATRIGVAFDGIAHLLPALATRLALLT